MTERIQAETDDVLYARALLALGQAESDRNELRGQLAMLTAQLATADATVEVCQERVAALRPAEALQVSAEVRTAPNMAKRIRIINTKQS